MKRNILLWQFSGFAVTSILGTILHYLYEWTDKNIIVAAFSGVNESTWEHMKLLYFPLLVFSIFQRIYFKDNKNYWCIKLIGILTGLLLIPILFYTYNGAIGKSPDWLNIVIFFVSAASAFAIEAVVFGFKKSFCKYGRLAVFAIILVGVLFVVFSYNTPDMPLFTPL